MINDPILLTLTTLENHRAFERLCCDILSGDGFPTIVPIGGTGDGGRDAILRDPEDPECETIFAFTLQNRWKPKLLSDCKKIKSMNYKPKKVVFVCVSVLSGRQREIESEIYRNFGWKLEIYDLERLRGLLVGKMRHLLDIHKNIFTDDIQSKIPKSDQSIYLTDEKKKAEIKSAPFIPFILAGGRGTRVIHLSSGGIPKQFWRVYGRDSMLQNTVKRLSSLKNDKSKPVHVLSVEEFRSQIEEQTKDLVTTNWYEPTMKGTATAIAYAIKRALREGLVNEFSVVGFFPADHYIYDSDSEGTLLGRRKAELKFKKTVYNARRVARSRDSIVLLGLRPKSSDANAIEEGINYGWIRVNNFISGRRFRILDFIEKPEKDVAKLMLIEREHYLWNAGIFIARVDVFLRAFGAFIPGTYSKIELRPDYGKEIRSCSYQKVRRSRMFDDAVIESIVDSDKVEVISISAVETLYCWEDLGSVETIIRHFERRATLEKNEDGFMQEVTDNNTVADMKLLDFDSSDKIIVVHEINGIVNLGVLEKHELKKNK